MKLSYRYNKGVLRSRSFEILLLLISLKCGYIRPSVIECDWSVQRLSCPPYATTDWDCLQTRLNCTNGEKYHCLRDGSGEWTEICAVPITCSKGQEPVLKYSQIICTKCKNPERYEPVDGTESYKYSECRRIKTTCPQDITHECPVDEAVRHSQDRQCRCDHKQHYMPQNYDLNTDTWKCKQPDDLNCIPVPCPEDVYGNAQTMTENYRCIPLLSPVTQTPSKKPKDRSSLPTITQTSTKSSRETGQTPEPENPPVWITIIGLLTGIPVLLFAAAIIAESGDNVAFLLKKRYQLEKPDPPCELFVDTTNYTSLGLSWKPPGNEKTCLLTDYVLDMKEAGDEFWKRVATMSYGTTEFEVKDLKDGTAYLFQIAAKNKKGIGKSLVMKECACTKPFACPAVPRNINGYFDKENKHIKLEWEPPLDDGGLAIIAFRVDYCYTSDNKWKEGDPVSEDGLSCNISRLVGGCKYKFRVQVRNEKGWSDPCELLQPLTYFSAPNKPTEVRITKVESDKVMLTWKPPKRDGGTAIKMYYVRTKHDGEESIITFEPKKCRENYNTEVPGLRPESTYYFGVCAVNDIGPGEYIETEEPTVLPKKIYVPGIPERAAKDPVPGYTDVILSWQRPKYDGGSPVTGFFVEEKQRYLSDKRIGLTEPDKTDFHIKDLTAGKTYTFCIYAQNKLGNSKPLELEVNTKPTTKPGKPSGPVQFTNVGLKQITISWRPSVYDGGSPIIGYCIDYFDSIKQIWTKAAKCIKETTYTVTSLQEGGTYVFHVRAINAKGESEPLESDVRTFLKQESGKGTDINVGGEQGTSVDKGKGTDINVGGEQGTSVDKGLPAQPTHLIVELKDSKLKVSWLAPDDVGASKLDTYEVWRKANGSDWQSVAVVKDTSRDFLGSKKHHCSIQQITAGVSYYFRVSAKNKNGTSGFVETTKPVVLQVVKGKLVEVDPNRSTDSGVYSERSSSLSSQEAGDDGAVQMKRNSRAGKQTESEHYKTIINRNIVDLKNDLAPDVTLDYMKMKGIGIQSQHTIIEESIGPLERNARILKLITTIGFEAYKIFKTILHETKQFKLLDALERTETEIEEKGNETPSTAFTRTREPSKSAPLVIKEHYKTIINRNIVDLKNDLAPDVTLDYMKMKGIGIQSQHTIIEESIGPLEKNARILKLITTNGFEAYKIFKTILHETKQFKLLDALERTETEIEKNEIAKQQQNGTDEEQEMSDLGDQNQQQEAREDEEATGGNIPSIPVGPLLATYIGATDIKLDWQPPEFSGTAPINKYFLQFECENDDWDFQQTTSVEDTVCHITGLQENTNYRFRVKAENQWGQSDPLEMVEKVKTKTMQAPLPPTGPIEFTEFTEFSVRLSWKPPEIEASALNGYIIEYKDIQKTFSTWKNAGTVSAEKTTWVQHNLEQGHEYKFRVLCNNAKGTSKALKTQQLVRPLTLKRKTEGTGNGSSEDKTGEADERDIVEKDLEEKHDKKALDILEGTRDKDWNELLDESVTRRFLEESLKFPGEVSTNILESAIYKEGSDSIPYGFMAYESPDNGNSLFNSVSLILFGNIDFSSRLRLAAALEGIERLDSYIKQYFGDKSKKEVIGLMKTFFSRTSADEPASFDSKNLAEIRILAMKIAVKETAMPGSKCNPLQVQFLSSATGFCIKQHFEKRSETFYGKCNQGPDIVEPAVSRKNVTSAQEDLCIHILWVSDPNLRTAGKRMVNRVYPVMDIKKGKQETTL